MKNIIEIKDSNKVYDDGFKALDCVSLGKKKWEALFFLAKTGRLKQH